MTEKRYCICGAAYSAPKVAAVIWSSWDEQHTGEGHAPCTATEASRARRRNERAAEREYVEGRR